MCDSMVKGINIIELFKTDIVFKIPLYQRGYAWTDIEIKQLIEDIKDIDDDKNYYLGSLIIFEQKNENKYEVVDGQQRLTTLYLLMKCLNIEIRLALEFACRERSKNTLADIEKFINNESIDDPDSYDEGLRNGIHTIKEMKDLGQLDGIKELLHKVIIYTIKLPPYTDLNRYFEIMNTRGEQLEQHDIVKAELMRCLDPDTDDPKIFAAIWSACSDLTGYVQMHFDTSYRKAIFGEDYNGYPIGDWVILLNNINSKKNITSEEIPLGKDETPEAIPIGDDETSEEFSLLECLKTNHGKDIDEDDEDKRRKKIKEYGSIIDFSVFLLHTLHVYVDSIGLKISLSKELDDKQLIQSFKNAIPEDNEDKIAFSKGFALCLLRTRFLFDTFLIKREYNHANEIPDSCWSLKKFKAYKSKSSLKSEPVSTLAEDINKDVLMMQSCLRVSYTTPKSMHWITDILKFLYGNSDSCLQNDKFAELFASYIEKGLIQTAVKDYWKSDDKMYMGIDIYNIVFNYLDYLLWKKDKSTYKDFTFDFRNSVEHFYPQNPSNGSFSPWNEKMTINEVEVRAVDQFGNLALVTSGMNSRLSNQDPAYKVSKTGNEMTKLSIKLQIMSNVIRQHNIDDACETWKNSLCTLHGKEMLEILREACFSET